MNDPHTLSEVSVFGVRTELKMSRQRRPEMQRGVRVVTEEFGSGKVGRWKHCAWIVGAKLWSTYVQCKQVSKVIIIYVCECNL